MTDLSDSAANKLQAVLLCRYGDRDHDFTREHFEACRDWFKGLSDAQRHLADWIIDAYEDGDEACAEKIASSLPPAPRCPLLPDHT